MKKKYVFIFIPIIFGVLLSSKLFAEYKLRNVYDDTWHYPPTGWMQGEAFTMESTNVQTPAEGGFCVKLTYDTSKAAWAGFFVQASEKWRANGGTGIDLSNFSALSVRARSGLNGEVVEVQFGVGGDNDPKGKSDTCSVRTVSQVLSSQWQTFIVDLAGKNLSDINGLVVVVMKRLRDNIKADIYIDDIKFIGKGPGVVALKANPGTTPGAVTLNWNAPSGDFVNTGYVVKYSTSYIHDQKEFDNATTLLQAMTPKSSGQPETFPITGLTPGQSYYFAIETTDDHGNHSELSNLFYLIARPSGIGINVDGDVVLGRVNANDTVIGSTPFTVTNSGGLPTTLSLSVTNPPGWVIATNNNSINQYVLMGAFATNNNDIVWDAANHALSTDVVKCSSNRFAGDQTGVNIPVGEARKLWIRFTAPVLIDTGESKQSIGINITANSVD